MAVDNLTTSQPSNGRDLRGHLEIQKMGIVGIDSLDAVMHPAITNDLYFVADGSGGHVFAETLEEHNRNVVRWRKIEKERALLRN